MIPDQVSTSSSPRPRKGRRPARAGTCQICGRLVVVSETVTPPHIRPHGYDSFKTKLAGVRVECTGSEKPPLEFESTHTESTLKFCRAQLIEMQDRQRAIAEGSAPPIGLTGVNALRVRFDGAVKIEADQRRRDVALVQIKIETCQREIDTLTRLLVTRVADPSLTVRDLRHCLPRIGDLFRKNSDGRLYRVESTEPAPAISRFGSRRPVRAPHYWCRCDADGTLHRFLQSAVTRALNSQGGTLLIRPARDSL